MDEMLGQDKGILAYLAQSGNRLGFCTQKYSQNSREDFRGLGKLEILYELKMRQT